MAARKLQSEIDKTLKKVSEGVEVFESIYDKMAQSTNQTQKEKLETDLKTQIKKLQRLRDQIKTWAASNDIKDKSTLQDNRKLIETQMEKFKACEKEMKTKAFSKEGLIAATRLDPKEKAKHEQSEWLSTMVGELERQVEQTEAELGLMVSGGKKKSKAGANNRQEELVHMNSRRTWHISRLEIVLRLLENGTLSPETVADLREDVSYFVESNTEEEFDEDEGIYDDLNLDAEEEAFGLVGDDNNSDDEESMISDLPPRTPLKDKMKSPGHDDDSSSTSLKHHDSPVLKKQSLPLRKPSEKPEPPKPPIPQPNFIAQPMSLALKAGLTPSSAPIKPVMRYAAAAGAGNTPTTSHPPPTPVVANAPNPSILSATPSLAPPTPALSTTASIPPQATSPPQSPSASISSPLASSIAPPSLASHLSPPPETASVEGSLYQDSRAQSPVVQQTASESPSLSPLVQSMAVATLLPSPIQNTFSATQPAGAGSNTSSLDAPSEPTNVTNGLSPIVSNQLPNTLANNHNLSPLPQQVQQAISSMTSAGSRLEAPQAATNSTTQYPPGVPLPGNADRERSASGSSTQQQITRNMLPGSLGDLVQSFDQVKSKAAQRMTNPEQANHLLEKAMNGAPLPQDAEKPKYYIPRNPYNTPPYYPQTPLANLSSPALFGQLDVETLFYVFYFLPGTYLQYLAANELKKQSWRFHVKYLTWFQRHSEPQAITEEYEQGVYVYFDWEGSWCQRKKSDFRFEYRYLSED